MRKPLIILITKIICLISIANITHASLYPRKPVAIPPEMYKIDLPFELEVYLNNPDSRMREAAVKRLGQIGGSDAISVLMKFFDNESYKKFEGYIVKYTVILSLRQIGGEEAKGHILKILSDTLKFGPLTLDYSNVEIYSREVLSVICHSLDALNDYQDADVIQILNEIAKNQDPPSNWHIAQTARKNLLKIDLKRKGISEIEDKVNYLVSILTKRGNAPDSYIGQDVKKKKTEEALKNGAIEDTLIGYGTQVLPYLEKSLASIPENSPRAEAIKMVMKDIERISKYKPTEAIALPSIKAPQ